MQLLNSNQHNGAVLNWVRTGPRGNSTVVLIHPVGYDLTYWGDQIDALQPFHDVIAVDLPGHGRSTGGPAECDFGKISVMLAGLIKAVSDRPVHVIGISVGGMIAQSLVLAYPSLVRSLCLIGTASTFPAEARAAMFVRAEAVEQGGMQAVLPASLDRWFTGQTRARRPDLIERVSRTLLADDPAVHAAMWRMIATFEVRDRLHEIGCPTLVLVGDQDPSTPPAMAEVLAENIPGARKVLLANTSHIAMLESPDAVNQALLSFLAALR